MVSQLPFGEYQLKFRVSAEDAWSSIPNYNGSIDVLMLSAVQPERVVSGEASRVTLTLSSGSVAQNGDRIRFVKNPTGFTSINPCAEYGYPLPESMTISFLSVSETASEQYEATTNGNDFTSLLSAGDKVIVVDRDDVDKKSYKMTISSITADKITFVEFLNAIDESKQFMLQKVNEFELEVVNGVTQTKEPVSFATANADVTVCYIRKPVANNAWYALANGFHVVSVDTLGVTNVMEPAKHIMAVKDQPVTIQFRGVGLRYADRAYFVEAGAPCANDASAVELDYSAESDVFTFGVFTFPAATRYELCYMYGSTFTSQEAPVFRKVEAIEVSVHTVLATQSVSKGLTTGFVADYERR